MTLSEYPGLNLVLVIERYSGLSVCCDMDKTLEHICLCHHSPSNCL